MLLNFSSGYFWLQGWIPPCRKQQLLCHWSQGSCASLCIHPTQGSSTQTANVQCPGNVNCRGSSLPAPKFLLLPKLPSHQRLKCDQLPFFRWWLTCLLSHPHSPDHQVQNRKPTFKPVLALSEQWHDPHPTLDNVDKGKSSWLSSKSLHKRSGISWSSCFPWESLDQKATSPWRLCSAKLLTCSSACHSLTQAAMPTTKFPSDS